MTAHSIPLALVNVVLKSEHVLSLLSGAETHDAALRLVAQVAPFTADEAWVLAIVRSALPEGYIGNTLSEVAGMLASARKKGFDGPPEKEDKASKGAILAVSSGTELVSDEQGDAHLGIPLLSNGLIHHPIRSTWVKAYVRRAYYKAKGKPLSKEALAETLDMLEATALFDKPRVGLSLRLGRAPDGSIFVDPGWAEGGFIRVTDAGWSIENIASVRFRRSPGLGSMPRPERGGNLSELKALLSLGDRNWALLLGFIINCLRPDGPYMFLLVEGEQGSGKSVLCTIIKRIIDPSAIEKLRIPKTEHDLMIQAAEQHLLAYDNASGVRYDMSDALCALATGSGFSTRRYFTDNESRTFKSCRPIIINGIGQYANRPDLLERSIQLQLPSLPVEGRRTEREILARLDELLPLIFGCLLNAMVHGLAHFDRIEPPRNIRMADAAHWIVAAEPALGLKPGTIAAAIVEAQHEMIQERVTTDPLVLAIMRILTRKRIEGKKARFEGTIAELLTLVQDLDEKTDRNLPTHPAHLSNALQRLGPGLKAVGVTLEFKKRTRRGREVSIQFADETERS